MTGPIPTPCDPVGSMNSYVSVIWKLSVCAPRLVFSRQWSFTVLLRVKSYCPSIKVFWCFLQDGVPVYQSEPWRPFLFSAFNFTGGLWTDPVPEGLGPRDRNVEGPLCLRCPQSGNGVN